ncbi:MAG: carboxylesterase family protein [Alphaproteobacteria bacterium]|nr:carboxylesterase family protein [Alphaproteobacteria bacterium]
MTATPFGSRRALLKASVAMIAFASTGALAACTEAAEETAVAADPNPVVATRAGQVRGSIEDGISVFKGVRYGADTSTTRFAAPQPAAPWDGVVDAMAYASSAPQAASGDGGGLFKSWRPDPPLPATEDCLFLNVWTPEATNAKARPVLVWYHGGGFATGSGSSYAYDGVRLAKRGDVVVVTVNHRLNQFGYLNLAGFGPQFADSGAAGALDMVLSLEWVRDNIAAFGGDPGNVLIFGESGGGSKVSTLMAMDGAKGLFHRAVVQSGPRIRHAEPADSGKAAEEVVSKLGLTAATIDQIRTLPVADIQAAAQGVGGAGSGPVLDGRSITRHPFDPDGPPQSADVPLLIGSNRTEGTSLEGGSNAALFDVTFDTLPAEIQRAFPGRDAARIIALYREKHPDIEAPELYFMATADNSFLRNSVTLADRKAAQGAAPVFFYMLDWETPVMGGKRYVPHALDIGMAFDNVAKSESMSGMGPEAQAIADQMSESWLAFARTGDPNNPRVPTWPAYTPQARSMMVFRTTPGVEADIRSAERALIAPAA